MKKISMFFLLLWPLFSTTLFASKSSQTPPYTHSFFNSHGFRGVLDPSDRWDIHGNPIYAEKKESESSDSSFEDQELTISEERDSEKELEKLDEEYRDKCKKLADKLYSPKMEKIWHHGNPYDHADSLKKTSLLNKIDPSELWNEFQKENNSIDSKPSENIKTYKSLSLSEFAAIIDGETESESEDLSNYSDDDSTESESEKRRTSSTETESDLESSTVESLSSTENDSTDSEDDEDLYDNENLIDNYTITKSITEDEMSYAENPFFYSYEKAKKRDAVNFLKACYKGYEDTIIIDFLEKYKRDLHFLYRMINETYPTPLFWATINGNLYIVNKLLPYVQFTNPFDRSTLFYAVLLKRKEVTSRLLSSCRFSLPADHPALRYHPHIDLISRAKTLKNFFNSEWFLEWTTYSPLKAAVRNNDYEMVELLINAGASDVRSIQTSALSHTTDPRILELLINHKFLSPKLLEQKLFFSQNKKNLNCKTLWKDKQYQALSRKSKTPEEYNEQVIKVWKKHLIKPGV